MYFIVNISKPPKEITIGDLNFCLGPNKAIDLEKVRKRSDIEESKDLKTAIRGRLVQLRHATEVKPPQEEPKPPVAATVVGITESDLEKIRETVRAEFATQLSQVVKSQGIPSEMATLIGQLTTLVKNNELATRGQNKDQVVDEEPDTIDESILVKMNEKAVKNSSQNAEGSLQSDEQKVEGSMTSKAKR